jgi:hypothetical protein
MAFILFQIVSYLDRENGEGSLPPGIRKLVLNPWETVSLAKYSRMIVELKAKAEIQLCVCYQGKVL